MAPPFRPRRFVSRESVSTQAFLAKRRAAAAFGAAENDGVFALSVELEPIDSRLAGSVARTETRSDIKSKTRRKKASRFQFAPRAARQIIGLASALLFSGESVAAPSDPQVDEFMAAINRSITELAARSGNDAAIICRRMTAKAVNIDAVATNALRDVATRMSSRQRADYRAAALRWAVRDCVRMNGDNSGKPLTFAGLRRAQTGGLLLATRSDQPPHTVVWRLSGSDGLKAVDVVVDGRSMTLALREETTALLSRSDNNIDIAIATLGR